MSTKSSLVTSVAEVFDFECGALGALGVHFAMWAPGLAYASVIGDFNEWDRGATPMQQSDVGEGSIWEVFVPGLAEGCTSSQLPLPIA